MNSVFAIALIAGFYTNNAATGVGFDGINSQTIPVSIAGFNTTLGTLDYVTVSFTDTFILAGSVDNATLASWSGSAWESCSIHASYDGSEQLSDSVYETQSYSGLSDFQPYAFGGFYLTGGSNTNYYSSGDIFDSFLSDTTFNINFDATDGSNIEIFFADYAINADVSVTYYYNGDLLPGIPEPNSGILTVLGLGCLLIYLKR